MLDFVLGNEWEGDGERKGKERWDVRKFNFRDRYGADLDLVGISLEGREGRESEA